MKNYSTYAALLTDSPEKAAILDAWLDERTAEQDVTDADLPAGIAMSRQDNRSLAADCGDYDPVIQSGQVRILSKRYTNEPDVIPFIAVLEKVDEDSWLIAPFSQYALPASPGEMTTGIDMIGRQVIQAWNGQVIQGRVLEKSFLCGELDVRVREDASSLYRNQKNGESLPADFNAMCGPAIIMDADPRRDYMEEATARLRPLATAEKIAEMVAGLGRMVAKTFEDVKKVVKPGTVAQPWFGLPSYALAAAGKDMQTTVAFEVRDSELSLSYSPEEQVAIFTFFDKNDRPDRSYDGYAVLGAGFEFLGTFHEGTARVPSEKVKDWFQIADSNGVAVELARKDR